ncbi:MAG: DNA repair protein RecO [Rickettsiales bacterium]|jgi:DNA repair protein RecO (recombination protein O)|nr:DNA repair protein RecO [Rickettsiales bacterium]
MKLEGEGMIIELRPFGPRDLIGRIFMRDLGVLCGIFKAGQVAKTKPLVGQFGHASWSARLDSMLGSFHFENEKNLVARIFGRKDELKYVTACFDLLSKFLPERERYGRLFKETMRLISNPTGEEYLDWELCLLSELGYGLALDICGNCGAKETLGYISPKTGRAICEKCGRDFKDKLFELPPDLNATKYFLEQISDLPPSRKII